MVVKRLIRIKIVDEKEKDIVKQRKKFAFENFRRLKYFIHNYKITVCSYTIISLIHSFKTCLRRLNYTKKMLITVSSQYSSLKLNTFKTNT